ncbi:MAG: fimbria/pilus periplasmic chaperone [Moraxellaceae bacterium]|nr:fimbria/pilus periplasmic chaperone [Moraxellaceae bacterium]
MSMKRLLFGTLAMALATASVTAPQPVNASVVIAGTRVVYPESESEVTVRLTNDGKTPALTQTWLDRGDPNAAPSTIEVPFTVTPPVARIDPGKAQTIRIIYTGEPLPKDKETVFWMNMLEVPPKPGDDMAESNTLQMAYRTRIKLFFRPAGLKASDAAAAPARVVWRLHQAGSERSIQASNPSPFHVSIANLEVKGGGRSARFDEGGMIGPGETKTFPLKGEVPAGSDTRVMYHAINDYGGAIDGEAPLGASAAAQTPAP